MLISCLAMTPQRAFLAASFFSNTSIEEKAPALGGDKAQGLTLEVWCADYG